MVGFLNQVAIRYSIVASPSITLYHGTTSASAEGLLKHGWKPNSYPAGANQGQSKYLYLTNEIENARWFSEQKGENVVLEVTVPKSALLVDPEDGHGDTLDDELNNKLGFPAYVVCFKPLAASNFKRVR
jgi:hypothetical protein